MDHPAYHGFISRERCEELLTNKGKDGAYLIRDSETIHGALCLCVYKQKVVYTYRILQSRSGYFTLQVSEGVKENFFKSLKDLVHHYEQRNQGLETHLRYAIKIKTRNQQHPVQCPSSQVLEEENDYENVDNAGDYVAVLPN